MRPADKIDNEKGLAVGTHCPYCAAPMYRGVGDAVLVCLAHGDMSPETYKTLWRRLNGPTLISNAANTKKAAC